MEKILIGVLSSEQPFQLKKTLAIQIANAGKKNIDYANFENLVKGCLKQLFETDLKQLSMDKNSSELILLVLKSWLGNFELTKRYFDEEFMNKSFKTIDATRQITFLRKLLLVLDSLFSSKQKFNANSLEQMQFYFYDTFTLATGIEEFSLICNAYLEYPHLLPKDLSLSSVQNIVSIFVKILSLTPISQFIALENKDGNNVQSIFKLLNLLLEKDRKISNLIGNALFKALTTDGKHPSICIAKLLKCLNLDELSLCINEVVKSQLTDDTLTLMTCRLVDWICLPDPAIATDQWVMQVLKYLIQHKKYQVLSSVIDGKINQIFHLVYLPVFRRRSLSLMTFMLISYLHSPKPFHEIAVLIPDLVAQLKKEETPQATNDVVLLGELSFTLMYQYPGFPDIYEKLLASLQGVPKPSEEKMNTWLKSSFSISQEELPQVIVPERLPNTKVGLDNLGNTCYANSVIQALFNLAHVRKVLLERETDMTLSTTKSIQELFGLLLLTKRSSIAPRVFLNLSRPPWFQSGFQQDCSEYLKYLLDKLQTESSKDTSKDINQFLSGQIRTSVECLNCGFVSSREEVFNDIPLSFNQEPLVAGGEKVVHTLKGGDSSDMKRKIGCKLSEASDAKQTMTDDTISSLDTPFVDLTAAETPPDPLQKFNIQEMMCSYLSPELLNNSNKYYCETCASLQNAQKTMNILKYPKYLILTMKRFTYDVKTQKRSKLLHVVDHPQTFDFCNECARCHSQNRVDSDESVAGSSSQNTTKNRECNSGNESHFRLLSVIVHSGQSSDSGHYYAYTCEYLEDGNIKWLLLNDSRVSSAPNDCVSKLSSRFPQDTPYVCIYECYEKNKEKQKEDEKELVINTQQKILDFVNADNMAYERELQREVIRKRKTFTSNFNNDKDEDGFGPCGPTGGGRGGGIDGSKFVF
ncbi:ubiquitin carboxyl-terminal hydrolase 38-like isoform X2 [Clytia hemisphaerica]